MVLEGGKIGEAAVVPVMDLVKAECAECGAHVVVRDAPLEDVVDILPRFVVLRMHLGGVVVRIPVHVIRTARGDGSVFLQRQVGQADRLCAADVLLIEDHKAAGRSRIPRNDLLPVRIGLMQQHIKEEDHLCSVHVSDRLRRGEIAVDH